MSDKRAEPINWTNSRVAVLKKGAHLRWTLKQVAAALDLPIQPVQAKIRRLGLRIKTERARWTAKEDAIIATAVLTGCDAAKIVFMLQARNVDSVRMRIHLLGLKPNQIAKFQPAEREALHDAAASQKVAQWARARGRPTAQNLSRKIRRVLAKAPNYSQQEHERIHRGYMARETPEQIAIDLPNRTAQAIMRYASISGISKSVGLSRPRLTTVELNALRGLAASGTSRTQAAKILDRPKSTIRHAAHRYGISFAPPVVENTGSVGNHGSSRSLGKPTGIPSPKSAVTRFP